LLATKENEVPTAPTNPSSFRAFVSLSELAEDVLGLSRARVYELIERGALPKPVYDERTRRPMFTEELQRQALAVRTTGIGVDGSPVIFYRRNRHASATTSSRPSRRRASDAERGRIGNLVSGLHALGIPNANERSVSAAVAACYPTGIETEQESDVLRAIFGHFRRSGSA
jgi:hypothetical protein